MPLAGAIEDFGELEWVQLLDTGAIIVSTPCHDNVRYRIFKVYDRKEIYRYYAQRLKEHITDDFVGLDMHDGFGNLSSDYILFYFLDANEKTVATLYISNTYLPHWEYYGLNQDQKEKNFLKFGLPTVVGFEPDSKIIFSKVITDNAKYNALKYSYKGKGEDKENTYEGRLYFNATDDYDTAYIINQIRELDNKDADQGCKAFDEIIETLIFKPEMNPEQAYNHMLYSARELQVVFDNSRDEESEPIEVEYEGSDKKEYIYLNQGDFDNFNDKRQLVLSALDKAASNKHSDPRAYFAQGVISEYNNDAKRYGDGFSDGKAERFYNKAIKVDQNFSYAFFNLGILHAKKGKYAEAIECLKKCIEICPADLIALYTLGKIYEQNEDFDNAFLTYLKTEETITYQEKLWCPEFEKAVKEKISDLKKKATIKKPKKEKNKLLLSANMVSDPKFYNKKITVLSYKKAAKNQVASHN